MLLHLCLIILALVVLWIRRRYSYWKDRGVPFAEPSFPSGNLRGAGKSAHPCQLIRSCYQKLKGSGPFGGIYFFINPVVLALDLDFIKTILVKDFQYFHDRVVYYNEKDDPLSANLFAIEGSKWRNLRAKLTSTFTSGKMRMMFPTMVEVSEHLEKVLAVEVKNGIEVEMKEILARFTTDVIGKCAFGIDCNSLDDPNAEFRRAGRKVFGPNRVFKRFLTSQFRTISRALRVTSTAADVSQFFMGAVRDTIEFREKNKIQRNDFMNLLIELKNADSIDDGYGLKLEALTFEEVAAQAFVFFLAGFETSSTALSFCLYELALNPELQDKARSEVIETIRKHGSMTYDAIHEMKYIANCIDESLRKYPPGTQLPRIVTKEYKVPGTSFTLEKGTSVIIPVYSIHHDPEYYPNPERYDPDRFLPEQLATRNPYCFLPFGEGPRNCIGLRFGLIQARLGLACLLKGFRFQLAPKMPVPLKLSPGSIVLSFQGGLLLQVTKV